MSSTQVWMLGSRVQPNNEHDSVIEPSLRNPQPAENVSADHKEGRKFVRKFGRNGEVGTKKSSTRNEKHAKVSRTFIYLFI